MSHNLTVKLTESISKNGEIKFVFFRLCLYKNVEFLFNGNSYFFKKINFRLFNRFYFYKNSNLICRGQFNLFNFYKYLNLNLLKASVCLKSKLISEKFILFGSNDKYVLQLERTNLTKYSFFVNKVFVAHYIIRPFSQAEPNEVDVLIASEFTFDDDEILNYIFCIGAYLFYTHKLKLILEDDYQQD